MTAVNAERKNSVVSEGVHTFKVTKSEEKISQQSGAPYWNFTCSCTDEGPDKGTNAFLIISLQEQARFKMDQFLDAINAPESGSIDHTHCVGKTFKAEIVWETYNGSIKAGFNVLIPFGKEFVPKPKTSSEPAVGSSGSAVQQTAGAGAGTKSPF